MRPKCRALLAVLAALALSSCAALDDPFGRKAADAQAAPKPPPVAAPAAPSVLSMFIFTGPARPDGGGKEGYPVRFPLYGEAEGKSFQNRDRFDELTRGLK